MTQKTNSGCQSVWLMFPFPSVSAGKNWDFTAALSDFEQLRQVHAGNLTYSFPKERTYQPPEKEMARVGRPILHRQDEVVQGEAVRRTQFLTNLPTL